MSKTDNLLIVADSERDANMLYAARLFVPDPFIYFRVRDRGYLVLNDLEIDRARRVATHCRILPLSQAVEKLRRERRKTGLASVIRLLLRERGVKKVLVPHDFPLGLARELRHYDVKVRVGENDVFPERELKRADEIKKISAALTMAEVGLAEGIQALKNAKIDPRRKLVYHGVPLTADKLRAIINTAVIQAGGLPNHTIVAGGRQACDPHEEGYGVLRAHEPIILDVFPRSQKTGYFGDITRTVVKGRASEAVRRVYHTVAQGQAIAFEKLRHKTAASEVHQAIHEFFERMGYKTSRQQGRMQGFFHGTGHGVGLELHEAPRVGAKSGDVLRSGHVVTIEPGLYYPETGGVRLEDVAAVTASAPRNLTKFEKVLEV